mgnify:CR=1 FL=1
MESIQKTPELKKRFDEYKKDVDIQNKQLQHKYKSSESFYRGTSIEELDSLIMGEDMSDEWMESKYEFKSLSMNKEEVEDLYSAGVILEYYADDIRSVGELVNYTAEPQPFLSADSENNEILDKDVEGIGINYSSQMIDEEEVRVDKQLIYGTKVKNIIIDRININSIKLMNSLSKMFDIPNYNKEYGDEIDQLNKEYGDDVISMKELDEGFRILDKKYNDKIEKDLKNSETFNNISDGVIMK